MRDKRLPPEYTLWTGKCGRFGLCLEMTGISFYILFLFLFLLYLVLICILGAEQK